MSCQTEFLDRPRRGTNWLFFNSPVQEDHGLPKSFFNYDESYYWITVESSFEILIEEESLVSSEYTIDSSHELNLINDSSFSYPIVVYSENTLLLNEHFAESLSYEISPAFEMNVESEIYFSYPIEIYSQCYLKLEHDIDFSYSIVVDSSSELFIESFFTNIFDIEIYSENIVQLESESILRLLSPGNAKYVLRNELENFVLTVKPFKFDHVVYGRNGSIAQLSSFKTSVIDKTVEMVLIDSFYEDINEGELYFESKAGFIKGINVSSVSKGFTQDGDSIVIRIEESPGQPKIQFRSF